MPAYARCLACGADYPIHYYRHPGSACRCGVLRHPSFNTKRYRAPFYRATFAHGRRGFARKAGTTGSIRLALSPEYLNKEIVRIRIPPRYRLEGRWPSRKSKPALATAPAFAFDCITGSRGVCEVNGVASKKVKRRVYIIILVVGAVLVHYAYFPGIMAKRFFQPIPAGSNIPV